MIDTASLNNVSVDICVGMTCILCVVSDDFTLSCATAASSLRIYTDKLIYETWSYLTSAFHSTINCVASDDLWMMNWKRCVRKRSWMLSKHIYMIHFIFRIIWNIRMLTAIALQFCHRIRCMYVGKVAGRGRVVGIPASYSRGPGFKSRPGDRLSWLTCSVVFHSPSR
jgi:hypothetical protein